MFKIIFGNISFINHGVKVFFFLKFSMFSLALLQNQLSFFIFLIYFCDFHRSRNIIYFIWSVYIHVLGTGHFCTSDTFARASLLHELTLLHEESLLHKETLLHGDSFARRVTFARGDTFARRLFCTKGHFCTR